MSRPDRCGPRGFTASTVTPLGTTATAASAVFLPRSGGRTTSAGRVRARTAESGTPPRRTSPRRRRGPPGSRSRPPRRGPAFPPGAVVLPGPSHPPAQPGRAVDAATGEDDHEVGVVVIAGNPPVGEVVFSIRSASSGMTAIEIGDRSGRKQNGASSQSMVSSLIPGVMNTRRAPAGCVTMCPRPAGRCCPARRTPSSSGPAPEGGDKD